MEERRLALKERQDALARSEIQTLQSTVALMQSIGVNVHDDARFRQVLKDRAMDIVRGGSRAQEDNPDRVENLEFHLRQTVPPSVWRKKRTSIGSYICKQHVYHFGAKPEQGDQEINNSIRPVRVYPLRLNSWIIEQYRKWERKVPVPKVLPAGQTTLNFGQGPR